MNTIDQPERPRPTVLVGDRPDETTQRFGISDFERIIQLVLDNKWMILVIVGTSLVIGVILTLTMTPQYTAVSRIEISRQQDNVVDVEGVQSDERNRDIEFYDTQYALLEASSLADRVVRSEKLTYDENFIEAFSLAPGDGNDARGPKNASSRSAERAESQKRVSDILLNNIVIAPVRGSSLVDIRFISPDPVLSAQITNAWVAQFIQSSLDRRFAATADAREFLEEQLQEIRGRLEASERSLADYASANEIIALSEDVDSEGRTTRRSTLLNSDLVAMNTELARARAERIAAESEAVNSSGQRDNLTNSAVNGLRQRRAFVVGERAKLLTTFEPDYPSVLALTSQIEELDRSIAVEEARARKVSRSNYKEALQKERELAVRVQELKNRFAGQTKASIQYNIYQREVDTNRELYNGLLQRYKEIGVAGVGTNNVAIVDRAEVPTRASSPNLSLNLALALLAGLGLSAALIFLREHIDQSLRDPDDVNRLLGISNLGLVPDIRDESMIPALADPKSVASEAYSSIRSNLSFATESGMPRNIMFTSTVPNEGKSTSAFALSEILSRTGKRILLIDADMRNPSIHQFFDLPNHRGFSNFLSGEDDLSKLILEGSRDSFAVMCAGPIPPNPADLLSSGRAERMLSKLGEKFDHVILDAPPVLGLADAPLLARSAEGVVFVVEANHTKLRTLRSALSRLQSVNAHIFGAVVTKVNTRNSAYGYGVDYGFGYSYGSDKKQDAESLV